MKLERHFSKEIASDLRKETADRLRKARKEPVSLLDLNEVFKNQKKLPEEYEKWNVIKESFELAQKNVWGKIFKTEKYKENELFLNQVLTQKKEDDISGIQKQYKQKFDEILKNCPLSKEEREKYLSTESMEKMSLEDYLTLSKRLSGEAFYHVTRYGVRENTFMSTGGGHTQGNGEFINGLVPLLKDGNINSCTSTVISNNERVKSLINDEFLKESIKKEMSPSEIVDKIIGGYGTGYFLDRESAHFSYGKDLHHMYGGEKGYKVYFYYPVEYILQNDFFYSTREGQLNIGDSHYQNQSGIDQQYNDFEIFNFGKGVPIEAGILCITSNVKVDPETGSQYLLKDGVPILDENNEYKKPEKFIYSQDYWENYFKLHPELKPSKIIYGEYSTYSQKQNPDLKILAEGKKIHKQEEEKKQEFDKYHDETLKTLRRIFTDYVEEEINKHKQS